MNERTNEWTYIPLTGDVRRRITDDVTVASVFPVVSVSSVSDSVAHQSIKSINQIQSSSLFPRFSDFAGWLVDLMMKFDFFYE
jgi:hypothetical protein